MALNELPKSGESNDQLQLVLNAMVDGVCGLDAAGKVMFGNKTLQKMTGYSTEEMIGSSLHELLHCSQPDRTNDGAQECIFCQALHADPTIHIVGEVLWRKDGNCFPAEYWTRPLPSPSGPTSAVLVTIRDISDARAAQVGFGRREERFRTILANVPDVAWTSDQHGRTLYISPKVETIFGYTPQEVCAKGANLWLDRIHPEDFGRVKQAFRALFEQQRAFDEEYRLRRKDDTWIWVHDRAMATREEDGVLYADGIFSDITRRKQAEIELRSKTAFLEAQANSTIDGILVVGRGNQRILLNQRLIDLLKIPPAISADPNDLLLLNYVVTLVKDPELFLSRVKHLNSHPHETSRDEIELQDGMILDRYSAPVIDPKGSYYGRIWTFRDITERKRNEDVLRQLSLTVEQSPVSVVITDPQGNITYVNRKFTESTGYASEEVVGKNPRILKSGRSSPEVYRTLWSTISQGQVWRGEFCNKKKNGEVFWEAATITPITNAKGAITHFLAVKEDITDRKQAEERLRLTQFSVEHASDAIFWMDAQARIVYVNRATCRSLGFSREELVSRSIPDIDPLLPRETWGGFWQDLKARGSLTFESQLQTKGGRIFPVEVTANHFAFDGQEYGFAFVRDITERRRAENELRLTQFSVEHASEAIRWFDAQGRLVYANQTACRSLGRSREEMASLSIEDIDALVPQETWGAFWEKLKTLGSMTFEGREKTKQGLFVPVEVTANYLEFDGQEYSFAFARDITERKRAEEKVRESSEQVRLLLDSIPEAVYGIDLHGKCTFCNPACLDLLGYQNASELLGRDMHVVLHHTRADGTPYPVEECHIFEAFRRGYGTHIDNEVLWRRDGTSFPAEYWSHPIRRDGNLVGTVVTFVDITERKRTQEALRESEERYRLLFERNMAGVFRTTLEGRILECNQAAASMLGYDSPEELLATPLARIHHSSSDREAFLRKLKSEKSLTNHETMLRRKNGESSWAMLNVSLVAGNSGAADIVEGTFVDITERKLAEKELRLMQFSLEHACDAVHWMNAEGRIVYANRASCRSLGRSREELLCLTIPDIDPRFPKERWQTFWEELKVRGSMTFETQHQTKQKHVFPVEITATYLNFDGQEYCFAFARDITERRVAEERVQSLAYYDALTGLPNRILLRDRLTQALATARRQKHQVALLFLDLDRFKIINDSLGHTVGDLLLQEVAERLQSFAREQDTVARLGGDEFLIVLTNVKDIPAAAVAAERFMDAMTVGFVIQGHSLSVSCSLGISIFPEHGADSETLIKNADAAMYSAKDAGRNNFQFFTADMTAKAVERLTLENNLRTALDRQELFLVYQPQMEIATGKIIGLEALIRWRHPELGLVPPDEFISIAENSGLIMPIGEWVLRTACAQARKWLEEGFAAVSVAVNVSAIQFRQEGFPDTVGRVLQETGLPPQCLELELTESLLLSNADVMFSVLRQLTAMGLRLAIDDFGTGYSSLSYLKHFPVSKLKIDRSFVRDVAVNPDDAAIATAIISMAKSLNLKVIAEGVEDEAQMSFLRTHQCDEIQGYYFSKPLAVDEVAGKMRATDAELQARAQANGK